MKINHFYGGIKIGAFDNDRDNQRIALTKLLMILTATRGAFVVEEKARTRKIAPSRNVA